jgi:hypothetical protein
MNNTDIIIDNFNLLTNYCKAWARGRYSGSYSGSVSNIQIYSGSVSFSVAPSTSGLPLSCSFPVEYLNKYDLKETVQASKGDFQLEIIANNSNHINIETLKNALMDTKEYRQLKYEADRQKMSLEIQISKYWFPTWTL